MVSAIPETIPAAVLALLLVHLPTFVHAARNDSSRAVMSSYELSIQPFSVAPPEKCPPCFNCLLPAFTCGQYGQCDEYNGQCQCPPGWGGIDCLTPQCDSLADREQRRLREEGKQCECKDGWGGINCNVCKRDDACIGFPLYSQPSSFGEDEVANMTCYTGGETVFNNHQMCNVTNRKILDMLPDRPPQVTFSCDKPSSTCDFQFWTAQVESFYCSLDTCKSKVDVGYDANVTSYACEHIKCSCVPGRFICGEDGSVDIGDFLTEEIRGPALFSCTTGKGCKFEEPAMNQLINDIFGDGYISLECDGGECLHYSQVPGYIRPPKPDNTRWVALSAAGAGLIVISSVAILWYVGRARSGSDFGKIRLPQDEQAKLMADHVPASLHFSNITYTVGNRTILDGISGCAKPGQVMAIMGASGAGKSTFLDILARKRKKGVVGGTTLVNGREVEDVEVKKVVGFVDQEDCLMPTLTVYETVLYSALLRLPREMSLEAKKFRTLETMNELGILGIRDMRIGDSGHRSISGGEKRRVSIACELVTSPSILFLDEPTSGLDAYNAFNVIDSLVSLARDYNRTVVFTIHQPRSNIVALFDQLVLLAQGKTVYSGEYAKCQEYFESIGHPCPSGFNIADFLIDLTMQASIESRSTESPSAELASTEDDANLRDEERGLGRPALPLSIRSSNGGRSSTVVEDETELQTRPNTATSITSSVRKRTSELLDSVTSSGHKADALLSARLKELIDAYAASDVAASIREETEQVSGAQATGDDRQLPDVAVESSLLKGRRRASWTTQFRILSGRAFKNLYRDPALLEAHYFSSIGLALFCGFFFHNVTNDIAGFQNRLGVFFFTLALFGFSSLSSLSLFANERLLFMRERANGYYSSFTYFSSKVLFEMIPLRVVPPLLFGGIVYGLVGLVPTVVAFWKFMLTLVLFNLSTATVIFLLSVAFENTGVASLVGTLVMLFNLLFTGLLINRESVPKALQWLHTISFFHAGFEALAVNELRYLQLKEYKYGVELDVPAATVLSIFGLRAQSFWWPNISLLGIFVGVFTVASYITLHLYVKERR
ncbi:hypothetical protein NEOLEDRAFT_1096591 [Neolentinus lepideus HHB14362 ss-1]|uniref:ABC transporter domain-containing protein n=1 Tax=Neolentinus lepideus HHB14362 ss-1 TaxID=1314782 RepID=A0A165R0E2_9AGAM|nr:hypothetical protein NEOLEDRAFT_1096591 [Neolentinus lepideus HHB14362 ss-1]